MAGKPNDSGPLPRPTESEQEILTLLWRGEPATVREIWERLCGMKLDAPGYTGVLKLMQLMHAKGLVVRREAGKAHVYSSARPPERTRKEMVRDLMDRLFEGSAGSLVLHALGARKLTAGELAEVRAMLKNLETK